MKHLTIYSILIFLFLCTLAKGQTWDANFQQLAKRVIQTSANIKPGEVVVISGGAHQIAFLEALSVEVLKLGAFPNISLMTDAIDYTLYHEVPDKFLETKRDYLIEWYKEVDVWIRVIPRFDAQTTRKGVPQERLQKIQASQPFEEMTNANKLRLIAVRYPMAWQAEKFDMTLGTFQSIQAEAIDQDYERISEQANRLGDMLTNSKEVRITTSAGTDISFSVANRAFSAEDGIVSEAEAKMEHGSQRFAILPGGGAVISAIENSANGRIVIPISRCGETMMNAGDQMVRDMAIDFEKGEIQNIQATEGAACLMEKLENYNGSGNAKALGGFSIGLNPALSKIKNEDTGLYDEFGAGVVLIDIGSNKAIGGNNEATFYYGFTLPDATVTVDGKVVVEKGELKL